MNADQKKRIAHEISNWKNACNCRAVQLTGDRMAALLQELADGYDAPAGSSSLIYHGDGTCTLKPGFKAVAYGGDTSANLIGLPPVGELQIDAAPAHAELPTWENGDDPLVGGGLISRGKVDFTALGIWPSKPAPDAEPVAYVTGYYAGYLSIATIDGRVLPAGTALFTAPPAPSVPYGWRPFLTDVITAAGLLEHGKRDNGLAGRIGKFAFDAMRAAQTPAEPPADVARDAERYRWLRDKCRATGEHWGGRWSLVIEGPCPDGDKSSGAIDKAIDAAIKRQGGES